MPKHRVLSLLFLVPALVLAEGPDADDIVAGGPYLIDGPPPLVTNPIAPAPRPTGQLVLTPRGRDRWGVSGKIDGLSFRGSAIRNRRAGYVVFRLKGGAPARGGGLFLYDRASRPVGATVSAGPGPLGSGMWQPALVRIPNHEHGRLEVTAVLREFAGPTPRVHPRWIRPTQETTSSPLEEPCPEGVAAFGLSRCAPASD